MGLLDPTFNDLKKIADKNGWVLWRNGEWIFYNKKSSTSPPWRTPDTLSKKTIEIMITKMKPVAVRK